MVKVSQRNGRAAGAMSIVVGAAAAVAAAAQLSLRRSAVVPLVASSAVALCLGIWLRNRLYLDDPEARAVYVAQLRCQSFKTNLKMFRSAANVVHLLGLREARERFLVEYNCMSTRLSCLFEDLGLSHVRDCMNVGLLRHSDVRQMFVADCNFCRKVGGRRPLTFLWGCYAPFGTLSVCAALGALEKDAVLALLTAQLGRYQPQRTAVDWGADRATAPSADDFDDCSGATEVDLAVDDGMSPQSDATYSDVLLFGRFCVDHLGVAPSFFCRAVRSCPLSRLPYSQLLRHGLFELFGQRLVEQRWCEVKLEEEVRAGGPALTLQALNAPVSVLQQLRSGIITNAVLFRSVFTDALPGSPFVDTQEFSIIDFMRQHEALLRSFGDKLVEPSLWPALVQVKTQWELAERSLDEKFPFPKRPEQSSTKQHEQETKDYTAVLQKYNEQVQEAKRKRAAFLASEKQRIHAEFACRKAGLRSISSSTAGGGASCNVTNIANVSVGCPMM